MWPRITNYLKQPYPFFYTGRSLLVITVVVFLFTILFYYTLQPFDIDYEEHRWSFLQISVLHALVPALILPLVGTCVSGIRRIDERWTLGRELTFLVGFILLVGIGQFLIRDLIYTIGDNWSAKYLIEEVRNTFLIGIIFVSILIPVNFNRLYRKHSFAAHTLTPVIRSSDPMEGSRVQIRSQVVSDNFEMDVDQFVYARADGNYVEVCLNSETGQNLLVKRLTTKELEQQLADYPFILKTHRSYLVNLKKIKSISGNAQGYKLTLDESDQMIPVSRGRIRAFEQRLVS